MSAPNVRIHSKNNIPSRLNTSEHGRATLVLPPKRNNSFPVNMLSSNNRVLRLKSSMRVSSLDESIHSPGDIQRRRTRIANSVEISDRPVTIMFAAVNIREYEQVVGDNPSCSSGPPLG